MKVESKAVSTAILLDNGDLMSIGVLKLVGVDFAKPGAEFTVVADVPINFHSGSTSSDWQDACCYFVDFLKKKAEYDKQTNKKARRLIA